MGSFLPFIVPYILLAILSCNTEEKMKKGKKWRKSKSAKRPTGNEICNEIRADERTKKEIGIQPVYEILLMW